MILKKLNEEKLRENTHMKKESGRLKFSNSSLRNQQFQISIKAWSSLRCMVIYRRVDSF